MTHSLERSARQSTVVASPPTVRALTSLPWSETCSLFDLEQSDFGRRGLDVCVRGLIAGNEHNAPLPCGRRCGAVCHSTAHRVNGIDIFPSSPPTKPPPPPFSSDRWVAQKHRRVNSSPAKILPLYKLTWSTYHCLCRATFADQSFPCAGHAAPSVSLCEVGSTHLHPRSTHLEC